MLNRSPVLDRKPLGQLLLNHGILRPEQLQHAIDTQTGGRHQKLLGEILVEQNICTDEQITETLAVAYGVPYARLHPKLVDPRAMAVLPAAFISAQHVVPMFVVEGVLTVAVPEPANVFLTEEIVRLCGLTVQVVAATSRDIRNTLAALLPSQVVRPVAGDIDQLVESLPDELRLTDPAPSGDPGDDRLLLYWISSSLTRHADQLQIDAGDVQSRIRLRVDGRWTELSRVPAELSRLAVGRAIAMAGVTDRLSGRGAIRGWHQGRPLHLPLVVTPTPFGPAITLNVPDATRPSRLDKLGIPTTLMTTLQSLLDKSHGLLLLTAPPASGASTTLHACLRETLSDDRSTATLETSLVHWIDGVTQSTATSPADVDRIGHAILNGSAELCAIDPMESPALARSAVAAAAAGRKVIASMPCLIPAAALRRLRTAVADDPTLSDTLLGILAQRLLRKLCPACKQAVAPGDADIAFFGSSAPAPDALYIPRGCPQCQQTGYLGRTGVFELWLPGEQGFDTELAHTLHDDAIEKLRAGVTSVAEVSAALR